MFFLENLVIIPIFGCFFVIFTPFSIEFKKIVALWASLIPLPLSLLFWFSIDKTSTHLHFVSFYEIFSYFNVTLTLGLDGFSAPLISLTALLCPICIIVGWKNVKIFVIEYLVAWLILESLLFSVFITFDFIIFYIFFEATLLPMFVIIGVWGSRVRKIKAAYQLFLYTLFGSVCILIALFLIYTQTGSFDYGVLCNTEFSSQRQLILFFAFLIAFGVKIPMFPMHLWLPEAHVEAPTGGSVILAGILLKLGGYGFIRYTLPLFPEAVLFFTPFVHTLSLLSILYASFTTLRQTDIKKTIAYSSIAHIGIVTLGIFSGNVLGILGSCLLILAHGIVSPGLFLCIGFLYDRFKTRIVRYYGGLFQVIPFFSSIFLFFSIANLGLPGTANFVGEFLCLLGCFQSNQSASFIASFGIIISAAYTLWLFCRVCFGTLKKISFSYIADLNRREIAITIPLLFLTLWIGVYPKPLMSLCYIPISAIVNILFIFIF